MPPIVLLRALPFSHTTGFPKRFFFAATISIPAPPISVIAYLLHLLHPLLGFLLVLLELHVFVLQHLLIPLKGPIINKQFLCFARPFFGFVQSVVSRGLRFAEFRFIPRAYP